MAGALKKKLGLTITSEKVEDASISRVDGVDPVLVKPPVLQTAAEIRRLW
jgi:hypothetical protein